MIEEAVMKNIRSFITLVVIAVFAAAMFVLPAGAADAVTVKNMILVSDNEIVVEFSEPVKIEAPFMALRLVDGNDILQKDAEENWLQFEGYWDFIDETHDKIIWTMYEDNAFELPTIASVLAYEGALADYKDFTVKFTIEELAEGQVANGSIDNVTNMDGTVKLSSDPIVRDWNDVVQFELERDYEYLNAAQEPSSQEESSANSAASQSGGTMSVDGMESSQPEAVTSQLIIWNNFIQLRVIRFHFGFLIIFAIVVIFKTIRIRCKVLVFWIIVIIIDGIFITIHEGINFLVLTFWCIFISIFQCDDLFIDFINCIP